MQVSEVVRTGAGLRAELGPAGGAAVIVEVQRQAGKLAELAVQIELRPEPTLRGIGGNGPAIASDAAGSGDADVTQPAEMALGDLGRELRDHLADFVEDRAVIGEGIVAAVIGNDVPTDIEQHGLDMPPPEFDADGIGSLGVEVERGRGLAATSTQDLAAPQQAERIQIVQNGRYRLRGETGLARQFGGGASRLERDQRQDGALVGDAHTCLLHTERRGEHGSVTSAHIEGSRIQRPCGQYQKKRPAMPCAALNQKMSGA